jgi:hypothetical protein
MVFFWTLGIASGWYNGVQLKPFIQAGLIKLCG